MAFTKIDELFDGKKIGTVGIAGHIRPDADCISASLALWQYLTGKYKDLRVDVFLEEIPDIYHFIRGHEQVRTDFKTDIDAYDMFIVVDSNKTRIGGAEEHFDRAAFKVNIDHHVSNHGDGDENYLDGDASSTCELIYDLIDHDSLDKNMAETLYCGIIGDTGVFKYNCTSPKTMRIGADLISYGFDFNDLVDRTFYRKTFVQNQLLGRVLMEATLFMDGKCILGLVSRKTMEFYNATPSDLEGIVSQLMLTTGVACAIFLHELDSLEYKVSLRSNGMVDVSKIAEIFGGGGHVRAAGCNMNGTSHDCINNLSHYIAEQLQGLH